MKIKSDDLCYNNTKIVCHIFFIITKKGKLYKKIWLWSFALWNEIFFPKRCYICRFADSPTSLHGSTAIGNACLSWFKLLRYSVFSSMFPFYVAMPQKDLFWYCIFNSFPLVKEGISGFISNLCHLTAVWYLTSQNMMQLSTY